MLSKRKASIAFIKAFSVQPRRCLEGSLYVIPLEWCILLFIEAKSLQIAVYPQNLQELSPANIFRYTYQIWSIMMRELATNCILQLHSPHNHCYYVWIVFTT